MAERKQRDLEELHRLTSKISKPKITPILRGVYHIQGPVDELEPDIQASKEAPPIDNSLGKDSHLSSEAGSREVCLAPCFPGTHNHFQTVSNVELEPGDGMSDESGRRKAVKQGSFGNNKSKFVKSHACDDQPQTSETSNLVSACSSHDSASENADGKGSVRGCVNSDSCLYDGSKIMMSEEQVDDNHGGGSSRSGVIHGVHSVHRLVNESFNHVSLSNLKPTKAHAAVKLDSAEKTKSLTDSGGGSHTRGITRSSKRLGGLESVDTGKDVQTHSKVLGRETSGKDGSVSNSASESNSSQSNSTSKCRNSSAKCHENAPNGHVCTSSPHEIKETKLHPSPDKGDSRRCSGGSNFEEEPMHMEKIGGSSLISKKDVPKTSNVYEKMSLLCPSQTVNESSRPPGVIDVPKKHGENDDLLGPLPDKSSNVGSMEMAGTMPLPSNEAHIRTAQVAQNSASLSKNAGELIESAVVQVEPPSILFPVIASGTSGTISTFKDSSVNHLTAESTSATVAQRNPSVGSAAKIHPYAEAEHDQDPNAVNISTDRDDTAGLSSQPKQKDLPVSAQLEGCTTSSSASEKQGKLQLSQPSSESDHSESDLVEDDVKVCDICGDAGREEQLAVCSRCNDGAEHTYCMQVMLDKVPEGEWLCEECKSKENVESQKSDKSETIFPASRLPILKEKNKISKASAISKSLPKLDLKVLDLDMKQATKPATPRLVEAEPVSAAKRQASDKGNGSPNLCSPNRKPSLLREGSFKNLDTGKVKLGHSVTSSAGQSANHPEEIGTYGCNSRMQSRLQSPRNKFSPLSNLPHKSAQFSEGGHCSSMASTLVSKASTLSKGSEASLSNMTTSQGVKPKPKVKQVLDEVPQKHLLARNSSFCDRRKEGPVKMLGKSASFKSNTNTVSLSLDDMKLKLQSQNLPHAEDLKSLKQLNEGASVIGRKNSFKLDHPMNGSSPAASTGNLYLPRSDTKALQSDAKTKAASDAAVASKKDAEKTISCGNGIRKRLLSCHGEYVAPITNELDKKNGLVDEKTKIVKSVAVDTSMGSENILVSAGSQVQIQTPSSFDDTSAVANSSENKMMEQNLQQSGSKEDNLIGSHTPDKSHSNPSYTVQEGLLQTRDSSNLETRSKELSPFVQSRKFLANGRKIRCFKCKEIGHIAQFCSNKGNDAGISPRASTASAVRGSKEMTGKSKWDHAVETGLSQKTKNGEGDRLFIHSNDVVLPTTDLNNDLASKTPVPTGLGAVSVATNSGSALLMEKDGKKLEPCFREMPLQPFRSHVTCFAIPEHHYIWQGSFEVQRSGKIADFCDGVQAHLSTCASPKVVEAANGFPSRVQLEEIPRLSLWPVQFQAKYPTEDNIALYFFAKDVESYERDYKKLVENMLTNDLALKANVGSVELLIFTSDQLPDNSQRWNRLFFLWGVFRERKVGCLEPVSSSMAKPFGADRDVSSSSKDFSSMIAETTVVSKLIPPVCLGEDSSSYRTPEASEAAEATTSLSLPSSVDQLSNLFGHNESIEEDVLPSKNQSSSMAPDINPNSHQMACQLSANSSSKAPHNGRQRQSVISLEGDRDSQIRHDMDQPYLRRSEILNATESSRALPAVSEMQEPSSDSSKDVKVICNNQDQEQLTKEMQMVAKGKDGELQDSIDKNKDQLLVDLGGPEPAIIPIKKESSALDLRSNCKRQHVCFSGKTFKAYEIKHEGSNCASINGEHESKRIKRGNMLNSCGIDLNSTFPENEDIKVDHHTFDHGEEAESSKTAERCFFSVDFGHVRDREACSSNSWPSFKNNNDESLRSDIPNLELELGAGKQVKKGLLPLFLNVLDEKSCKDSHSDKGIDGADGGASSLSLSLAFPVPEKEKSENPVSASEKVFAEQPHVNTPLWLFGGCMDS
ncbi:uncharacterized protein LOC116253055 isoform X2 [Nymphaea colorata]|uniref:uncharacterized protein LOC116253055 isoform X2 n=1 Tax=Nymphaea colorata TaxID=210225 RepID=UPI00129E5A95|nr:uncharacterized protein LOC116253055 isoform X2 [Nymphaea colorata]